MEDIVVPTPAAVEAEEGAEAIPVPINIQLIVIPKLLARQRAIRGVEIIV